VRARPATAPGASRPTTLSSTHAPVATPLSNVAALCAVATREPLPPRILRLQLELLHLQLLAWTTAKYETALLENPMLDTTDTLAGTAESFELLLKRFETAQEHVLQAVEMLPLPPLLRGAAVSALKQVGCPESVGICLAAAAQPAAARRRHYLAPPTAPRPISPCWFGLHSL
jgi:hypothetical protein